MNAKRVLIADARPERARLLELSLADKYQVAVTDRGEECLDRVHRFGPDVILLDVALPDPDGHEVCRRVKTGPLGSLTQIVLIGGQGTMEERLNGYASGADDCLLGPFDPRELLAKVSVHLRIRNSLADLWVANARIQQFNAELERRIEERTEEIVATRDVAMFALAKLTESRDPETGEHLERIRSYTQILGEKLSRGGPYAGQIDAGFLENLYRSSPLHDIGKVGIPDSVLLKPGRLTHAEFEIMKQHTLIGARALAGAASRSSGGRFLRMGIEITRHHHERYDGTGYPDGLAGLAIPLPARIVALADVFDALTSSRVYKPAYEPTVAQEAIEKGRGGQFDPVIVDAFSACYDDFLEVYRGHPEPEESATVLFAGAAYPAFLVPLAASS